MNLSENILPIFPEAVLYLNNLNVNSNEIFNFCKNSNFKLTRESLKENAFCYSSNNLNVFNDLPYLKNEIKKHVEYYLYEILKYKMNYKFLNSWITKVTQNGYSQNHSHSNTFLSGVYYPIGNNDFKIKFHKEKSFWNIETVECNSFNSKDVTINIQNNNSLILFPSSLEHNIVKNNSNIDRYSIAFNINPMGYIGVGDTEVEF